MRILFAFICSIVAFFFSYILIGSISIEIFAMAFNYLLHYVDDVAFLMDIFVNFAMVNVGIACFFCAFFAFIFQARKAKKGELFANIFGVLLSLFSLCAIILSAILKAYDAIFFFSTGMIATGIIMENIPFFFPDKNIIWYPSKKMRKRQPKIEYCRVCGSVLDAEFFKCPRCGKQYHKVRFFWKKFTNYLHRLSLRRALPLITIILLLFSIASSFSMFYVTPKQIAHYEEALASAEEKNQELELKNQKLQEKNYEIKLELVKLGEANYIKQDLEKHAAIVYEPYIKSWIPGEKRGDNSEYYYHSWNCPRWGYRASRPPQHIFYEKDAIELGYSPCPICRTEDIY